MEEKLYLTDEEIDAIVLEEIESGKVSEHFGKAIRTLSAELKENGQELPELTPELFEAYSRCYVAGYRRAYQVYSDSLKEILC